MADQAATVSDPFAMWRDWVANSERQWNGFLNEAMATDQFSQTMGRIMDVYLNMQKSMNDVMGRYFSALNMPTRTDVLALGNRLTAIDDRLTVIEGLLAAITAPEAGRNSHIKAEANPAPRPPRTKKPA
ncbi:MAG: hypothetical protein HYX53_10245 [Chloroflexi bacterium]|nr:hypothetical protein [Chloroflexota bacterium]